MRINFHQINSSSKFQSNCANHLIQNINLHSKEMCYTQQNLLSCKRKMLMNISKTKQITRPGPNLNTFQKHVNIWAAAVFFLIFFWSLKVPFLKIWNLLPFSFLDILILYSFLLVWITFLPWDIFVHVFRSWWFFVNDYYVYQACIISTKLWLNFQLSSGSY